MKEDILDKYALNTLSDQDRAWIKKALEHDPSFQEELDFHADIVKGMEMHMEQMLDKAFIEAQSYADQQLQAKIKAVDEDLEATGFFKLDSQEKEVEQQLVKSIKALGEQELASTIKTIDKELEQDGFFDPKQPTTTVDTPTFSLIKMFVAAASVILVLTFGWQYIQGTTKQAAPNFLAYEHYPQTWSKKVALELSESGFAGNPGEKLQQFSDALTAYDQKNYSKAAQILKPLVAQKLDARYQAQAELILALSYFGNGEEKQALPLLQNLAKTANPVQETATWYLAMLQIKLENIGIAKEQLETLKGSTDYGPRATEILETITN